MSLKDPKVAKELAKAFSSAIVNTFGQDVALAVQENLPTTVPNPRVGVSVLIRNGKGEFLVGERFGSHGAGKISSLLVIFCGILHI